MRTLSNANYKAKRNTIYNRLTIISSIRKVFVHNDEFECPKTIWLTSICQQSSRVLSMWPAVVPSSPPVREPRAVQRVASVGGLK